MMKLNGLPIYRLNNGEIGCGNKKERTALCVRAEAVENDGDITNHAEVVGR